jgi:riboflavin biosynthesis pyrimidine reductase
MVAAANGVVAWRRRDARDDPVLTILGGDRRRPERIADRLLMRWLRCFGDVGVGSETVRQQPELILTPQQPSDESLPELYAFRLSHGLPRHPRNVVYSLHGRLPREHRMFNTPGIQPVVVTTDAGRAELHRRGFGDEDVVVLAEPVLDAAGLRAVHERMATALGTRYLCCEGGQTLLAALHGAGLLDEVFVTVTDVVVDESRHEGVLKTFDFAALGAEMIAEGRTAPASPWVFRRWRFNRR